MLLREYERTAYYSNLHYLLNKIKLQNDSIVSLKMCYTSINTEMMTTLSSHNYLPDYGDFTPRLYQETTIFPLLAHPQRDNIVNIHKKIEYIMLCIARANNNIK